MKFLISESTKKEQFTVILQNLKTFSEHIVIKMDNDGFHVQGMDSAHCCCYQLDLKTQWFDEYSIINDGMEFGVSANILNRIMSIRESSQAISIELKEDVMYLSFIGGIDKFFEIPLMDIEQEAFNFTDEESNVDLVISSKLFHDMIANLQIFDEKLTLNFTDKHVQYSSKGHEGGMSMNISFDDVIEYAIPEETQLIQSYSIKYFTIMALFNKLGEEFSMAFYEERPMKGTYNIGEESHITFYLAPKICDEDEYY